MLAIGPGMGQSTGAMKFLTGLLEATDAPVVLDADALNLIAAHQPLLKNLARMGKAGRTVVLTPHPGEMARLADTTTKDVQARRLETARIVGSDIAHAVPLTLVAGAGHLLLGHIDFAMLGSLLVGSLPGITIASSIAPRLPEQALRYALAGVLVLVAVRLLA